MRAKNLPLIVQSPKLYTIELQTTCDTVKRNENKTCFYSCKHLQVLAQDALLQNQMIVICAVQTQNHVDSFKDPVTMMILNVLMVSNVEKTTVQNPPMLPLSLTLILIAVIQVCKSKKRTQIVNAEMIFFSTFRDNLFELQRY